ncbi:type 1 fimbrial protein [Salmonella enterica subsp. enterica serovar Muenchen]|nr:type 1 fimbrial protein [Salmonella enterica subsp. enterica serovar Muenchen]
MMNLKYALTFAALVSSASAMAVQPIGNPSGTVSISGTVRNASCSIGAPSSTTVNFDISKADINNTSANDVITRENTPVTISFSNCQNTALGMTVSATDHDTSAVTHGLFDKSVDPDSVLYYYVGLEHSDYVSGGDEASVSGYNIVQVDGNNSASAPIVIKDATGSGNFDLSLSTILMRNGSSSAANLSNRLDTSYTYTFTYA